MHAYFEQLGRVFSLSRREVEQHYARMRCARFTNYILEVTDAKGKYCLDAGARCTLFVVLMIGELS